MMREDYVGLAILTCIVCAATSAAIAWLNMIRAADNRKDGGRFSDGLSSPSWYLRHPEELTERGLQARRRALYAYLSCFVFFALCWIVPILFGGR
jgi:hypothetical protein